ncbi:calcium homeostasis modulator protein 6-like [Takifugu rubripes]|uniref:calcium homeostasis modulator protein 6-like n=1 Tax=Takifugu rubripes TaxID=31033 RepID=UPI0011452272|nr:calcium homeostasis modulator protein 6-like [Takifugu rubripes]
MEPKKQWFSKLKDVFSKSLLVSNAVFGFILIGLEKLVELKFECPCSPTWNRPLSSAFFIVPAIMAFILMLIIQGCRCDKWCRKTVSLSTFVPAIVWLILLFLDGQYFACAMTDWKGRFVLIDKAAPQKWCEPISEGDVTPQELMLRSQEWNAMSQVIGMSLLLLSSCVGLTMYLISEHCKQKRRLRSSGSGSLVPGTPPETMYTAHHTHCAETHTLEIS